MTKAFAAFLFVVLSFSCSDHGHSEKKFLIRQTTIRANTYGYRVYVPENREPNRKLPVMLYLHGSGGRGNDNQSQLSGLSEIIDEHTERFSFIVVAPQCRDGAFWAGEMNEQAFKALDETIGEFGGDVSRLYLSGFSMGGNGTWQIGLVHPGKFAALVPIAGLVAPVGELSTEQKAALAPRLLAAATSEDPYRSFAEGIGQTPVWIFHGSNDEAVPVTESRKITEALKNVGNASVNYTEYENAGHLIVGKALGEPKLFEWLSKQQLVSAK